MLLTTMLLLVDFENEAQVEKESHSVCLWVYSVLCSSSTVDHGHVVVDGNHVWHADSETN
jgi:hypothetical protein